MLRALGFLKELSLYLGIPVLVFMAINYTTELGKQTAATQDIVRSQSDILQAIKQVTEDTRVTANQQTNIIICMLKVPVTERTTDVLNDCRKEFVATADSSTQSTSDVASSQRSDSSSQSAPSRPAPQSNSPQPKPSSGGDNGSDQSDDSPVWNPVNNVIDGVQALLNVPRRLLQ